MSKLVITIGAVLISGGAAAHPEHATGDDFGLVHFVTDPLHVALSGAAILLFLAVRWWHLRNRSKGFTEGR